VVDQEMEQQPRGRANSGHDPRPQRPGFGPFVQSLAHACPPSPKLWQAEERAASAGAWLAELGNAGLSDPVCPRRKDPLKCIVNIHG